MKHCHYSAVIAAVIGAVIKNHMFFLTFQVDICNTLHECVEENVSASKRGM